MSLSTAQAVSNRRGGDNDEDNQEAANHAPRLEPSLSLPLPNAPRRRRESPQRSPLPFEHENVPAPRAARHAIESMRLPGRNGNLIDCKNTLQSHSMANIAVHNNTTIDVAAAAAAAAASHSLILLELRDDNDSNGSPWTGGYKRALGIIGPANTDDSADTSSGMSALNGVVNCSDLGKYNSHSVDSTNPMRFDSVLAIGGNSSSESPMTASVVASSNPTGDADTHTNRAQAQQDQDTAVLVHAYLAPGYNSPGISAVCWIISSCAAIIMVVITVFTTLFLTSYNEPDVLPAPLPTRNVPMTTLPTAAPTVGNRAAVITEFINSIKLSPGAFELPEEAPLQARQRFGKCKVYRRSGTLLADTSRPFAIDTIQ